MPKSAKSKAVDFSKTKAKLGKGKQAANNAVNTAFKARSIALPNQGIGEEVDHIQPTTRRKLALDDLLSNLKHYSPGTRKDAILGLRELLQEHPDIIEPSLTRLIPGCARLIGDEDAGVRKVLVTFLSWFIPLVPSDTLSPHVSILLLFTTSAQTHIFPEIRIDAVKVLDLLLDHVPVAVTGQLNGEGTSQHGDRIIQGYFGLLNARERPVNGESVGQIATSTTVSLSAQSKLVVFESLCSFLRLKLNLRAGRSPTWYLARSFASTQAYRSFVHNLRISSPIDPLPRTSRLAFAAYEFDTLAEDDFAGAFHLATDAPAWGVEELNNLATQSTIVEAKLDANGGKYDAFNIARTLHSVLVAAFLDTAPSLAPSMSMRTSSAASSLETQLVFAVVQVVRCLYSSVLQDESLAKSHRAQASEELRVMLTHMSPYFPFTPDYTVKRDVKRENMLQELNLTYCELTSMLVLALHDSGTTSETRKASSKVKNTPSLVAQVDRVGNYLVDGLRGEPATHGQMSRQPLTVSAYSALLPTLWSLLNQSSADYARGPSVSSKILRAVLDHTTQLSNNSSLKLPAVEFVGQIWLLQSEPQYQGAFRLNRNPSLEHFIPDFCEWLLSLPRLLWETSPTSPLLAKTIALILLRTAQRQPAVVPKSVYIQMRQRLIPFFNIAHPTRGQIRGPYTKLPSTSSLRRLLLDLAATLMDKEGELHAAVRAAVADTEEELYWENVSRLSQLDRSI